ncbi:MAG: hypothetical protein ABI434_18930 [Burkholderiaceae bacterium]
MATVLLMALAHAAPDDDFAHLLMAPLTANHPPDWRSIESVPGSQWAPLPPKSLPNCLPDGGCYLRQGTVKAGGRQMVLIATGARSFVVTLYLRNEGSPFGEAAVLAALGRIGVKAELARCPVSGGAGSQNWYRLASGVATPAVLSIQTTCKGKPCEGFAITFNKDLPQLQPNQLKMYAEQCAGAPAQRRAISARLPHEVLAERLVALLPPTGAARLDWSSLTALAETGIEWPSTQLTAGSHYKDDPFPWMLSGRLQLPGRNYNVAFGGTRTQVMSGYLDEEGMGHPRGEDLLGALRAKGVVAQLVRCGPVYTQSSNNWYRLTSAATQPVLLRQSMFLDGQRVSDSYVLRLDGQLPPRSARDRDPGVQGCH